MYSMLLDKLEKKEKPIDVVVSGLGFMSFGFISVIQGLPGIRIPLVISRRVEDAITRLQKEGFAANQVRSAADIEQNIRKSVISVSEDMNLIGSFHHDCVFEATGTVGYATGIALKAIDEGKHLITMNPELQATVGSHLKYLADKRGVVISDVVGDQPGSIARAIAKAKLMGFHVLLAGNMKRYMDRHATQEQMKPWAEDKGLRVRQTVSFTDGTKQAIEMTLVANYFGMNLLTPGMVGPEVEDIQETLIAYDWENIPQEGVVDYVIGKKLFPGVFQVVTHTDPKQQKYLYYLGLGEGPRYVLFDAYHLCHLEVSETIAQAVLFGKETINNSLFPSMHTIAYAKMDLKKNDVLDGIGGDTAYGNIVKVEHINGYLPMGLAQDAVVNVPIAKDQPIRLSDVTIADTPASRLVLPEKGQKITPLTVYETR